METLKSARFWFCICHRCGETGNYEADYVKANGLCQCGGPLCWHGVYKGKFLDKLNAEKKAFKQLHGIPERVSKKKGAPKKGTGNRRQHRKATWEPNDPCVYCGQKGVRIFTYNHNNRGIKCACGECGRFVKWLSRDLAMHWITKHDLTGEPVEVLCTGEEE